MAGLTLPIILNHGVIVHLYFPTGYWFWLRAHKAKRGRTHWSFIPQTVYSGVALLKATGWSRITGLWPESLTELGNPEPLPFPNRTYRTQTFRFSLLPPALGIRSQSQKWSSRDFTLQVLFLNKHKKPNTFLIQSKDTLRFDMTKHIWATFFVCMCGCCWYKRESGSEML